MLQFATHCQNPWILTTIAIWTCRGGGLSENVRQGRIGVICDRKHATRPSMLNMHRLAGIVEVDGFQYEWGLRREPHWDDFEGWKGMTVALLQKDTQREALLEFPPPKRLLKGFQRGRLQINDAILARGIRAALLAGWVPASRGKPVVFMVDADGN